MNIASSFNLLSEIVPLSYQTSSKETNENFIEILSQRIDEFLHDDLNDECACAILNLLCQTQSIYLRSSSCFSSFKSIEFFENQF